MFPVVSVKRFDLLKHIHLPHRPPSLTLWMQDTEIYTRKVRVWHIMPNSRIPSEWSQMDQNEIHTSNKNANPSSRGLADLQQRSNIGN